MTDPRLALLACLEDDGHAVAVGADEVTAARALVRDGLAAFDGGGRVPLRVRLVPSETPAR